MSGELEAVKSAHRAMWASGDYPTIAEQIVDVAEDLVDAAEIGPRSEVLDVATGSGNAAIAAARRGARVTGLDLVPELLATARRRAADARLEIDWVEGDAEALPLDDASYDAVISVFGQMFAPRHARAASELLRVCRPGGTIGICCWTPEGVGRRIFKTAASYQPPAPDFAAPPALWGTEAHVRELLGPGTSDLRFERRTATFEHDSPESWFAFLSERFGPFLNIRRATEADGRWDDFRTEMTRVFAEANEADEGFRFRQEYLRSIARRS